MKIKDIALSAAYVGQRVVKAIAIGAQEVWSAVKYIVFKDTAVEQICVANFSSDGVGVTEEDAAKVNDIGTVFKGNTEITSFDELEKFSNVTYISSSAFRDCSKLESINLNNINTIGSNSFSGTVSLRGELSAPKATTLSMQSFMNSSIEKLILKITEIIGAYCFSGCANLQDVSGIDTVKNVGDSAFSNCRKLTFSELRLPSAEAIGHSAFEYTNVILVTELGQVVSLAGGIFRYCYKLTLSVLPSTITNIGYVFPECKQLHTVIIEAVTPPTLGSNAFQGCLRLSEIYVPDASVEEYKRTSVFIDYASKIKKMSDIMLEVQPSSHEWGCARLPLRTLYAGVFVPSDISIEGDAHIDNGDLVFDSEAAIRVNVTYKGKSVTHEYEYVAGAESSIIEFAEDGFYTKTNYSVGTKLDYSNQIVDDWKTLIFDISMYEGVILSGLGGISPRLYCYIDENDVVVEVAEPSLKVSNSRIPKPNGATKIIINLNNIDSNQKINVY